MHPLDFIESINDRITAYVGKMEEFLPTDLGLDSRSAYRLYVDKDRTCIVVNKHDDRTLQYYGAFEYVDKDYRREMGNWVFYSSEDERVFSHLEWIEVGTDFKKDFKESMMEDEETA